MLNVHALSGLDDKEIYHTFVKVISQCHMLAYLEAINHIFVFPEELVLPFFKSWATCVYYKDMGKRWYILVFSEKGILLQDWLRSSSTGWKKL
ncbi:uncharacterized protein [Glycine max]|uniref:uncharacterized protein isoform X2 n=1 Tax=Glycine max TaxID=3847 RepID=UPI001B3565A6|nr:uncharacterized protein LOC100814556 isoform X2 [Glycine max]